MALSSREVGITIEGFLDTLEIVFHLATIGSAEADNPSHLTKFQKRHVVEDLRFRCESDHAQLVVFVAAIDLNQRSFPIEFACQGERDTVLRKIRFVLGRVKLNFHTLL